MPALTRSAALSFLAGGGRVGAMMRARDWSRSPLGPPNTWPSCLRSTVSLLLGSRFPMFVAFGPDLGFLYNDAYAEILGHKHPGALGGRFGDIWAEIWPDISPLIDKALSGEATWVEDMPLTIDRRGCNEQTWFTFSYSPVHDEEGRVVGMFCVCTETTGRLRAEERLRESEEQLRLATEAAEVGLWDVDKINGTLFWPARMKAMFGISGDVPVSMRDYHAGCIRRTATPWAAAYAAAEDPDSAPCLRRRVPHRRQGGRASSAGSPPRGGACSRAGVACA